MARRVLTAVSILGCLALAGAQVGAWLEFMLIPARTSETRGPQGSLDLALGLLAGLGGVSGMGLAILSGVFGMSVASARNAKAWVTAIAASGVVAVFGLLVASFVLLALPRNPFHPFVTFIVIPVTTLAYLLFALRPSERTCARTTNATVAAGPAAHIASCESAGVRTIGATKGAATVDRSAIRN